MTDAQISAPVLDALRTLGVGDPDEIVTQPAWLVGEVLRRAIVRATARPTPTRRGKLRGKGRSWRSPGKW